MARRLLKAESIPDQYERGRFVSSPGFKLVGEAQDRVPRPVVGHRFGQRPHQFDPLTGISDSPHEREFTELPNRVNGAGCESVRTGFGRCRKFRDPREIDCRAMRYHAKFPSVSALASSQVFFPHSMQVPYRLDQKKSVLTGRSDWRAVVGKTTTPTG